MLASIQRLGAVYAPQHTSLYNALKRCRVEDRSGPWKRGTSFASLCSGSCEVAAHPRPRRGRDGAAMTSETTWACASAGRKARHSAHREQALPRRHRAARPRTLAHASREGPRGATQDGQRRGSREGGRGVRSRLTSDSIIRRTGLRPGCCEGEHVSSLWPEAHVPPLPPVGTRVSTTHEVRLCYRTWCHGARRSPHAPPPRGVDQLRSALSRAYPRQAPATRTGAIR
jgi:hypothetical protein